MPSVRVELVLSVRAIGLALIALFCTADVLAAAESGEREFRECVDCP